MRKYGRYIELSAKIAGVCAAVLVAVFLIRGCVLGIRDYARASKECSVFSMDIYVTYVYSGEDEEHVFHTKDKIKMKPSVSTISIVCLTPGGETDAMVFHVEVTGSPGGEKQVFDKEFFRNPDKPFTVTKVECVAGKREAGTY